MKTVIKKPKITHMAITRARINLGSLVKRAHLRDEYFILEKDGIPVAGLMNADELEDYLDVHNPKNQKEIAQGWKDYKAGKTGDAWEFMREMERKYSPKK